jgi:hypothetical protein
MPAEAAKIIDEAIAAGKSGDEIVQEIQSAGIEFDYSQAEGGEEMPMDEGMPSEGMEEIEGDPGMEEGMEEDMPFEPQAGGPEGGMRDMRISAVRFALNKAKEDEEAKSGEEY